MRRFLFSLFSCLLLLAGYTIFPVHANAQTEQLYVTNSGDNTVSVINPATGNTISTIPVGTTPRGLIYNGTHVYVSNSEGDSISVIDPVTKSVISTIQLGPQSAGTERMVLSPDNKTLYASDDRNSVYIIDTTTNMVTTTLGGFSAPDGVAVSPDGMKLYVVNSNCCDGANGWVSVINLTDDSIIATIPLVQLPTSIELSPDGSKAYVTNLGNEDTGSTVSVIDTSTNTVTQTITGVASPYTITLNANGTKAYVAGNNYFQGGGSQTTKGYVTAIDLVNNVVITQIQVGYVPDQVAISSDNATAYGTNEFSNDLSVIDTATNTVTNTFNTGSNPWGVIVISAIKPPANKDDCKNGGWENLTDNNGNPFKNQGACIRFFEKTH